MNMSQNDWMQYADKSLPALIKRLPVVCDAAGGQSRIGELYARVKPVSIPFREGSINLDIYESNPSDPVLIFHCGICNYSRFYFVFLAMLSEAGFNIVAIDRPGHGFSDGRRGDCSVEDVKELMPIVIEYATQTYNASIGLFGTSLGGITTFYLLPDLDGIKSAICHNWIYPGELADKGKWLLNAFLRQVNKFKPDLMIPIRKLVDPKKVKDLSSQTDLIAYFENIQNDPIYCQALTLRSVASYFGGYRPTNDYGHVSCPVLGLISEWEKVLPLETSKEWWNQAGFPEDRIKIIPETKHMIFHDAIPLVLPAIVDWFTKTLK